MTHEPAGDPIEVRRDGQTIPVRLGAPFQTARDLAARRLRGAIRSGELRPGDRLPSVRDMAAALHVSRTPITQALQTLREERLVEDQPEGGWFVAGHTEHTTAGEKR